MASVEIQVANSRAFAPQSLALRFNLSRKRLSVYCLFFIILLTTVARFYRLDAQSFWFDETATLRFALNPTIHDTNPPAFYLLVHAWLHLGQSEFFLRMLPALTGILSVLLMYRIGSQLVGPVTAIVATLLASISPILVWHSQDLRMYSQVVLLVLLIVHFYLRAGRSNSRMDWIGYIAAALLAGYTHLYTLFIPFILSLHYLCFHRQRIRYWVVVHGVIAAGYLPWLLVMLNLQVDQVGTPRVISIFNILYTYFTFTTGYSFGPTVNELRTYNLSVLLPHIPIIAPLTIVAILLTLVGIHRQWRRSRENSALIFLWAVVPVVLAVIMPLLYLRLSFNPRYVLFALPAFLWLLASGIEGLGRRAGIATLLVLSLYSGLSLSNYYFDNHYAKEDVRGAAAYVAAEAEPDDAIVVITVSSTFAWYFQGSNLILGRLSIPFEDLLTQTGQGRDTIWLVQSRPWQTDPQQHIRAFLDSQYMLLDTRQFVGVSVYRYCVTDCVVQKP